MGHKYTLFFAAKEGRADDLIWVLKSKKVNPNLRDDETRYTALHFSAGRGHTDCMKILLQAGAEIDARESDGLTALHLSVYHNNQKAVKLLIDNGADINCTSRFGSTPLHQAAFFGHTLCAEMLLAAGAMVNVQESWGQTPLVLAAQRGHSSLLHLLLQYNASVEMCDLVYGLTALHVACQSQNLLCGLMLLDAGASPNFQDNSGRTPLHEVLSSSDFRESWVTLSIEYGASPLVRDHRGNSPVDILKDNISQGKDFLRKEHQQNIFNYLTSKAGQPRTLQQLCRVAIRQILGPNPTRLVQCLDIPNSLKMYLHSVVPLEALTAER